MLLVYYTLPLPQGVMCIKLINHAIKLIHPIINEFNHKLIQSLILPQLVDGLYV